VLPPVRYSAAGGLFREEAAGGHVRHEAVTDWILAECVSRYGPATKDDVFHYVYGVLHSPAYLEAFPADLRKSVPRLPLVSSAEDFRAFARAGEALSALHLGYESADPFPARVSGTEAGDFTVVKMRFHRGPDGRPDRTAIWYNERITVAGIPLEAYRYVLNSRPAVEEVMERYRVTVHRESGIRNDPNDWARETGRPRYILDLLLRVITVSLETMRIVRGLPVPGLP
jgi:predicted helicase